MPETAIDQAGEKVYTAELKGLSLARHVQAMGASFLISLNANTTFVKVYAITQDIYLKWATHDLDWVNAGNFDEIIIAGAQRVFPVPNQVDGAPFTRIMLVGRVAGATAVVIEK
ncbi:MAG: hypothetical protein KKB31_07620 [Nanoarchaeota archaeon]|nr:hypothetical protein [Nanoarchaeota archaeon]